MRRLKAHGAKTLFFTIKVSVFVPSGPSTTTLKIQLKAHFLSPGTVLLQHLSDSLSLPKIILDGQCGVLGTFCYPKLPQGVRMFFASEWGAGKNVVNKTDKYA